MKNILILILELSSSQLFANNNWVKVYDFESYDIEHIESFSKDTFVISTYFNMKRNGNITFEYALWLTTDLGESWNMIYQDSTSVEDIPKEAQRIADLNVSKTGVISFIRQDGFILFSEDYGNTWDSVSTSYNKVKVGLISNYNNKLLINYKRTDTLFFFDLDSKSLETIYLPPPLYNDNPEDELGILGFTLIDENRIIYSLQKSVSDSIIGFSYISEDRGKTWTIYERSNIAFDYYFVNSQIGYSCGESFLVSETGTISFSSIDKTIDGGKTWTNLYIGESDVSFRQIINNKNIFICLPQYKINPWSSNDLINWQKDSISVEVTDGGPNVDVSCDDYGNCLMIQRSDHIHRILNPESSIEDYHSNDENISHIDYYDLKGNNLGKIERENDLNTGLYIKAYKDKYNNIIKSEKLIITK